MFRLFIKKDVTKPGLLNRDVLANRIVNRGLCLQQQWARWMGGWFSKFSTRSTKAVLIGFCITAAGFSAYNVFRVFDHHPSKLPSVIIEPIKNFEIPDQIEVFADTSSVELRLVEAYLDSLYQSVEGRKIADGMLENYPALAEHFYDSQKESLTLKNKQR